MIEICPAGPPKLIQPSRVQKRMASPKVGQPWAAGESGISGESGIWQETDGKSVTGDGFR